jgi:methanogenic corrinoid protein MtbC1
MNNSYIERFDQVLLSMDRIGAQDLVEQSRSTMTPMQFIEDVIVPCMEKIGTGWEQGHIALSQIYMSGRICEALVDDMLLPLTSDRRHLPGMAIAVLDDFHMMGKRIVYTLLRSGGYELLDYGRVSVDELVRHVMEDQIKTLLISVLMLPSALQLETVSERLKQEGADTKIIVGGAPFRFDTNLWREVGADAMGHSASDALQLVTQVRGEKQ